MDAMSICALKSQDVAQQHSYEALDYNRRKKLEV